MYCIACLPQGGHLVDNERGGKVCERREYSSSTSCTYKEGMRQRHIRKERWTEEAAY